MVSPASRRIIPVVIYGQGNTMKQRLFCNFIFLRNTNTRGWSIIRVETRTKQTHQICMTKCSWSRPVTCNILSDSRYHVWRMLVQTLYSFPVSKKIEKFRVTSSNLEFWVHMVYPNNFLNAVCPLPFTSQSKLGRRRGAHGLLGGLPPGPLYLDLSV